jgi:hypothetical protein
MAVEKFYGQTNAFHSEDQNTVISNESLFIKKNKALKKSKLKISYTLKWKIAIVILLQKPKNL